VSVNASIKSDTTNRRKRKRVSVVKLTSDKRQARRDNMKNKKCTSWAIVATMERKDGTWYTETITDVDNETAQSVDTYLTEYCENDNQSASEKG